MNYKYIIALLVGLNAWDLFINIALADALNWNGHPKLPISQKTQWHINLFRFDFANNMYLAWNPSLSASFHIPKRFGILEFLN